MSMNITLTCSMCGEEKEMRVDSDRMGPSTPMSVIVHMARWIGQYNEPYYDLYCSKKCAE